MFTKKPEKSEKEPGTAASGTSTSAGSAPQVSSRASQSLSSPVSASKKNERIAPSVIGEGLTLVGNATSRGEIQVDGEVQGDIQCAQLLVGETATITGGVMAEDVIVRGKILGSIRGLRVTLQASSHVEGDIYHQSLAIEQGAFFEGKSRRDQDPLSGAKGADGMPQSAGAAVTNGPASSGPGGAASGVSANKPT